MSNIRVDLDYQIKDGTEVVFRSPVDCSQVTGLKVYYDGGSQEFMFADAHGNNVGDIDHLFAEDVVVKVILDVTTSMAFVQNADTNAYLEGRFADLESQIGSASMSDIGIKEEIFSLTGTYKKLQDGVYVPSSIGSVFKYAEQADCSVYWFGMGNINYYKALDGKRLKIKTYMYGEMAIYDRGSLKMLATNADADIIADPESGIVEVEFEFKYNGLPDIYISFCENPYLDEPLIYEAKGTVWEEIKELQEFREHAVEEVIAALPIYNGEVL